MADYQHLIGVRYTQVVVDRHRTTIICEVRATIDDQAVVRTWIKEKRRYAYAVMSAEFLEERLQNGTYQRKKR
jgi:hypothetical protein